MAKQLYYDNTTKTWTIASLAAVTSTPANIATLQIVATANTAGENIENSVFVSAANGLIYTASTATVTDTVSVTVLPLAAPSMITVVVNNNVPVCMGGTATLVASASGVENPVFRWYETAAGNDLIYTDNGTPFVTGMLFADTIFYVAVSGSNYCADSERLPVNVVISCTRMRGTLYPFVYTGEEEEDKEFDSWFPYTVSLYELPPEEEDRLGYILEVAQPVRTTTAVYYDGSIYVPGTPKYPGILGRTNQPGKLIRWFAYGRQQELSTNYTPVSGIGDVPQYPVGLFTFENLPIGHEYVMRISRAGYLDRFAKIKVTANGLFGHRYIIPGDVLGTLQIRSHGASRINANFAPCYTPRYNSAYDLDANCAVNSHDTSLLNVYLNIFVDIYQDTFDWVWDNLLTP
jgi:hypothetical protein